MDIAAIRTHRSICGFSDNHPLRSSNTCDDPIVLIHPSQIEAHHPNPHVLVLIATKPLKPINHITSSLPPSGYKPQNNRHQPALPNSTQLTCSPSSHPLNDINFSYIHQTSHVPQSHSPTSLRCKASDSEQPKHAHSLTHSLRTTPGMES